MIIPESLLYLNLVLILFYVFRLFFSYILGCLVIFCCTPDRLYWVVGTEVIRLIVCGFMLIWLGIGLFVIFSIKTDGSGKTSGSIGVVL